MSAQAVARWTMGAVPADAHAEKYLARFRTEWSRAGLDPQTIAPLDGLDTDDGLAWVQANGSSFIPTLESTYESLATEARKLRSDLWLVHSLFDTEEKGPEAVASWTRLLELEEQRGALLAIRIGLVVVGAVPDTAPRAAPALSTSLLAVVKG